MIDDLSIDRAISASRHWIIDGTSSHLDTPLIQ